MSLPLEIGQMSATLWEVELIAGDSVFQQGQHLTNTFTLLVLLSGEGILERGSASCPMRQDTVYICPPESTFGISAGGQEVLSVAQIRFGFFQVSNPSRTKMHAVLAEGILPDSSSIKVEPAGRLHALCRSMHEQFCSAEPLRWWRAQALFQELLGEVLSAASNRAQDDTHQAMERSKAYMEAHFADDLTIDRLAGIAGLSPKYFVDLFKKRYGVSALDHLTQIRMSKAKQLMLCSERLLRDVAHEVGYRDEFYFSRKFKKEVGMSPSAFIKKRQRKVAVYGSTSLIGYLMPLEVIPYAAPLHAKWTRYYNDLFGADIPIHLDAYRQNHNRSANLDKLAAASPDLIICSPGLDRWEQERLAAIAPVFELPSEQEGWQRQLLAVAELLEEPVQAQRWIAAFERKLATVRDKVGKHAQENSVLTLRLQEDQLTVHCNRGMSDVLYSALGFQSPYPAADLPFNLPMTLEQLDACGADHVLLLVWQESDTLRAWKRMQETPQWLSLKAVRENRLHLIASEPWREYSPIALERMLDDACQLLSGNRP